MKVKQCSQCRGIFQAYASEAVCPRCMEKMDQDYVKIRDYLYHNPQANISELTEGTGVEERFILTFLREDRLRLAEPTDKLICASCAKPITKGKYCEQCLISIQKEIDRIMPVAASIKEQENNQKDRMHLSFIQKNR